MSESVPAGHDGHLSSQNETPFKEPRTRLSDSDLSGPYGSIRYWDLLENIELVENELKYVTGASNRAELQTRLKRLYSLKEDHPSTRMLSHANRDYEAYMSFSSEQRDLLSLNDLFDQTNILGRHELHGDLSVYSFFKKHLDYEVSVELEDGLKRLRDCKLFELKRGISYRDSYGYNNTMASSYSGSPTMAWNLLEKYPADITIGELFEKLFPKASVSEK